MVSGLLLSGEMAAFDGLHRRRQLTTLEIGSGPLFRNKEQNICVTHVVEKQS
jgi:hypothetical protein